MKASAYSYKIPKNLKNIPEHIFGNNLKTTGKIIIKLKKEEIFVELEPIFSKEKSSWSHSTFSSIEKNWQSLRTHFFIKKIRGPLGPFFL